MKHGDFTALARHYRHRPGYSRDALGCLARHAGAYGPREAEFTVADVGAGTGKLTEVLAGLKLHGVAVEPNDAMREEGRRTAGVEPDFQWQAGSAEQTGLEDQSVDWVLMASSFHWTDSETALKEFHRILRPGGYLTVLWNPRDLHKDALQNRIDSEIRRQIPNMKRRSSGGPEWTEGLEDTLLADGLFGDLLFIEAPHEENMSRERYLGVWKSVNDIQVQAGEDRWNDILGMLETETAGRDTIMVRYRTRAWTVRRQD
ncbi:class I SAM-dependent methyltransferase [Eilatimonas milleporae]|uniref:Methyltransferase family protein n=1 Tax=Eilatimonas milleporae TaxID=911205 RepID=A0A3M0C043_9PROT|nr:class I SAM-dependent methyltransferase [Eilatimonas milleporae]RMB00579.1 methyltransferase family protein [Eilatimonas milleporae]